MALVASLKAGNIAGSDKEKGIPVTWFTHEIASDIDPKTNRVVNTRAHGAFTIRKQIDMTTPFFHRYLLLGSALPSWTLKLWEPARDTAAKLYMTIVLTDARVVEIDSVMPSTADADLANVHEYEDISFEYSKIEWRAEGRIGADEPKGKFIADWLEEEARTLAAKALAETTHAIKSAAKGALKPKK